MADINTPKLSEGISWKTLCGKFNRLRNVVIALVPTAPMVATSIIDDLAMFVKELRLTGTY